MRRPLYSDEALDALIRWGTGAADDVTAGVSQPKRARIEVSCLSQIAYVLQCLTSGDDVRTGRQEEGDGAGKPEEASNEPEAAERGGSVAALGNLGSAGAAGLEGVTLREWSAEDAGGGERGVAASRTARTVRAPVWAPHCVSVCRCQEDASITSQHLVGCLL